MNDWAGTLTATDMAAAIAVVCAMAYGWTGLSLKGQRHCVWIAAGLLTFVLGWSSSHSQAPADRYASTASMSWLALMLAGLTAIWTGLAQHYSPANQGLAKAVSVSFASVNVLLWGVLLAAVGGQPEAVGTVALAAMMLQALVMAVLGLHAARSEPGVGHVLSAMWLAVFAVTGMYQIELHGHDAVLPDLAFVPFLGMCITVLPAAVIREHRRMKTEIRALQAVEADLVAAGASNRERSHELLEALRTVRSSDRSKARILAAASYEIPVPLTGLMGSLELLRCESPSGKPRLLVDQALASANQLSTSLGRLLSFARVDPNGVRTGQASAPLRQRLLDRVPHWQRQAQARGLVVTAELRHLGDAVQLDVDVDAVLGIVDELMASAIRFTTGGNLVLEARMTDTPAVRLELTVRYKGNPLAPECEASIFEPFGQGGASAFRPWPCASSGLGLAIARRTAQRLGGELGFSGRGVAGNAFKLTFPATTPPSLPSGAIDSEVDTLLPGPQEPLEATNRASSSTHLLEGKRILLVDDNAVVRMVLAILLRKAGARPVECQDGAEAVRMVGCESIDAVLMDVSMPGMNGLEATRQIRLLQGELPSISAPARWLPIIGISAHALPEDRRLCIEAGMTTLVCKPINWPVLCKTLQDALV